METNTDKFSPEGAKRNPGEIITGIVDQAMAKARKEAGDRNYLGASEWGEPCERKLGYKYHKVPRDPGIEFSGKTLRIFDMGHDAEERVASYLRIAGFELHTNRPDGSQYGFSAAEGRLKGHIDGVITAGPDIKGLVYPCLWENKGLGNKSWTDVNRRGVRDSKPIYYAQCNTYCAYMELPNALFSAINRDTGEILFEVIQVDGRNAQESSDRAVRVINSGSPEELSKITNDPADFRCKFCDFRSRCWGVVRENLETTTPSWLARK
jgi:hypothetical protein